MDIKRIMLILIFIITLALCSTVSAADTTNNTNYSAYLQSSTSVNSTHSQPPDPLISGVVKDNSTNKGLANVTIKVIQNNAQVAETKTHSDGTYSVNFTNSNTNFIIIASKLGYMPFSKTITVARSSNPDDVNFYGTANFRLYKLLKYSGSASSYVLNVGALPQILLDVYAGKSSAYVNSTSPSYATGGGTPLEVKLLTGSLLAGLLDVYSTGDEGSKIGGLLPSNNASLLSSLKLLGLNVGLLNATSNSSTNPPTSSGASEVASLDVGIQLLLSLLSVNADVISAGSSVTPNFNTGILVSSSNAGVADITLTLLGIPLLEIKALQSNAIASVNGKPGGAAAKFTWKVADIKALGISILDDLTLNGHVNIGLLGLNILTLSLGSVESTTSADGTYAKASGDALRLQVLGLLGGGLINLVIGHADAEVQVPAGGLHVNTADVGITKTVNNTHPNYLQNVKFTLTAHNYGPDTATGITVVDKLPAGLKFISSNGNYNPTTGTWTIENLENGQNIILEIIAQVITSNTQITNIANINGNSYDPEPGNDESNVTVTVDPASDLGITKTVNNTHPNYLDKVTFTLTAHNYGPDTATGITVVDKLPSGLKFISADGNYNSTTGIWTIGSLTNGANAILNILTQVIASNTQITNIADITGTNYDQNSTNNESNSTLTVNPASDLGITKTVNNSHPNYLDRVTFTLTAHNYGPDTATGAIVTDKLPTGLKFISADGNYNSTTGVWTIGNLANGSNSILEIIAQVITSNTQITNIADINGTNYDQNSTNNENNSTVIVDPASDLGITKTVDNAHLNYLQNVEFTLTAHNYGPNAATGVIVLDKLPSGLTWASDNSNGDYNPTTGVWNIRNLANGADAILKIIAQITASNTQITNIASINGTNYDQNSTNNESNSTVIVNPASDLGITKIVDNSHPNYLQSVKFTLTAHNYGPDNATGVKVTDKLPNGFKFISYNGDGTYNSTTGIWTIGNLANGAKAVLNIIAQAITANTQITNIAVINGTNYDQNSTNDQSNATVNIGSASDLGITITVNNAHPKYLDYVTFTLTAHNYGPNDASYVKVYNTLPDKLRYVSDDSNGAFNPTFDAVTGLWTVGYMNNGATAVLHIVAQAMASNVTLTDVASITDPDPVGATDFYDPNQDNDQASVTVDVGPSADLNITKTVNNTHPNYLQNVTFKLTAHNNGPNNATGIKVTDELPTGLKFISYNGTGTYNSVTGVWTVGNLANGATAVLNIVAQVVASNTQLINTASITGYELDLNSTNNNANATMNVGPASDLGITKTVDNTRPKYLQKVTFTLTAHNYGPNNATEVKVTDKLPNGLKFISYNGNGTYNSTTGLWTIGNLATGKTAVLKIIVQAITPNVKVTNNAVINGPNYDQKSSNNKASAAVTIGPAADLAVTMSVNNAHPKYLQKVTFTITAYNYGPMNAKNVTVTLKMPKGFKYISKDHNIKYNPKTGVWTIGNLKNGGKLALHIAAQAVTSNIRLTSTASIKGTAIIK
jgi:uncharacterized repeat protein (TIGR01451 family)